MEAVILIGIQASGKSTFYRERFFKTHVRINLDMLKTRQKEAILLDSCIEANLSFVVDNTNPTAADRKKYIEKAKAAGFIITGYYFDTDIGQALLLNSKREDSERIPAAAVRRTRSILEEPYFEEGFSSLYRVSLKNGSFIINEW